MEHWAISDIHGHNELYQGLTAKVFEMYPNSKLHLLGDYVDRGPDSIGTLYNIMSQLGNEVETVLLGNHDYKVLRYLRAFIKDEPTKICLDPDTKREIENNQDKLPSILNFLEYCAIHKTLENGTKLVHAYYSGSAKDRPLHKQTKFLYGPVDTKTIDDRGLPTRLQWWDRYDGRYGKVIFGHYHMGFKEFEHCVSIDPDVGASGVLLAYNLKSGEVITYGR